MCLYKYRKPTWQMQPPAIIGPMMSPLGFMTKVVIAPAVPATPATPVTPAAPTTPAAPAAPAIFAVF